MKKKKAKTGKKKTAGKNNIRGGRQSTPDGTSSRRLPSGENPATPGQSSPVSSPSQGEVAHSAGGVASPASAPSVVKPRPRIVSGRTFKFKTGCGNIYITINKDGDGKPFELFVSIGKAGGCAASQTEMVGRLVSYALRSGLPLPGMMEQLRGIGCHTPAVDDGQKVLSCADAIAKAIAASLQPTEEKGG